MVKRYRYLNLQKYLSYKDNNDAILERAYSWAKKLNNLRQ